MSRALEMLADERFRSPKAKFDGKKGKGKAVGIYGEGFGKDKVGIASGDGSKIDTR